MEIFVVVYSIIIFLIAAAFAALSLLYVRGQKKKVSAQRDKLRQAEEGTAAFLDIAGKSAASAYLLIDAATGKPCYISSGISYFLGASPEELYEDTANVKKYLSRPVMRGFERAFSDWNRTDVLIYEFPYSVDKTARVRVFASESGGKKYLLFVFGDVTDDVRKMEKLREEHDEALQQASEKSSFLSNMSHEIRTPMNGIIGMMSLARMNIDDKDRVLSCLEKAENLGNFLIGMINDILDISKIESGRMKLYNAEFDIFAFADKISNMFSSTMRSKGINYAVETVDFTAHVIEGDEMRLTQVATNLISNAQKFTPVGGSVTVTFKQLDIINGKMQLMMRCRDTGKGIAPEAISRILKPFEQEEASTSHRYGGTGLGLTITDNFVKLMGGNIVIDSVLGKGSDFSVFLSLPVVEGSDVAEFTKEQTEAPKTEKFSYEGCRILLAEDNEINAEIATEILENEGAKVTHACDGAECVDIFENNPEYSFDLLLVDIQMPNMDGRTATKRIRASGRKDAKDVAIIALSADAFVEDIVLSKQAGMDEHVSKPIDFDHLKKTVGEVFAAKKRKING